MERILAAIRNAQQQRAAQGYPRVALLQGQRPEILLLACSDSRVVPALMTGNEPGQVFVVRNAGNIVPPPGIGSSEEGTIEFGIEALGIRDIVICGHARCGAVEALLTGAAVPEAVGRWLAHATPVKDAVDKGCSSHDHQERWDHAVRVHLAAQMRRVREYPCVQRHLADGLQIHGWIYDVGTAELSRLDPDSGSLTPVVREDVG